MITVSDITTAYNGSKEVGYALRCGATLPRNATHPVWTNL